MGIVGSVDGDIVDVDSVHAGSVDLPGLDLSALTTWLDATSPGLRIGRLRASLLTGGRSNLTYALDDDVHHWALRRPPLAHVLPTAHDMGREFRVISALAPTTVPVPAPVLACADPQVIGAAFYLMEFVAGRILDSAAEVQTVSMAQAGTAGEALVDTLVELHSIDPAAVGLAGFGRPEGYLGRQVDRWHRQWLSSTIEIDPAHIDPVYDAVQARLAQTMPESGPAAIVHGDYRLTNVILDEQLTRVLAVLDWEMATLGDPLTDLGLMAVYHQLATSQASVMPIMRSDKGFLTAEQLLARYASSSGRDLSGLRWYVAFGYYKLAVISQGIAARHAQGKTVGEGFESIVSTVAQLLASCADELEVTV